VPTVSLLRCPDYDLDRVEAAVRDAIGLVGGIDRYVKSGDRALLKVNLLAGAPPEKAVTTHPALVRAMIRLVRSAGAVPRVGDCSGFEGPPNAGRFRAVCRHAGILQLCEEEGVDLVHLSADSVEVENPLGRAFKRFTLSREVMDADVVINLPKMKTHGLTLFSGGVKNLFGCMPGLHKAEMHLRAQGIEPFSQMLVDLLVAVRPALTLMDGIVGMEGNGPRNGRPRQIGALLASPDPVALDAVACQLIGIQPLQLPTTYLANMQGVGVGDPARIEVLGESPEALRVQDFELPVAQKGLVSGSGRVAGFLRGRLVPSPRVVKGRCQGCWVCLEHCPSEAITRDGEISRIDYGKCVRCYCCQELCPHDAIDLRRPLVARLLGR